MVSVRGRTSTLQLVLPDWPIETWKEFGNSLKQHCIASHCRDHCYGAPSIAKWSIRYLLLLIERWAGLLWGAVGCAERPAISVVVVLWIRRGSNGIETSWGLTAFWTCRSASEVDLIVCRIVRQRQCNWEKGGGITEEGFLRLSAWVVDYAMLLKL